MGLLDGALDNDITRFGLGLLAASGPTNDPMKGAFGNRLMQAVGSFDDYRQQKAAQERAKQMQEFQAFQMEQAKAQAAQQAAAQADALKKRSIFSQNFQSEVGPSADGFGPTRPMQFDHSNAAAQLGQAGFGEDALELMSKFAPKPADYKVVGNSLLQVGKDGVKPVFTEKEKPAATPAEIQGYQLAQQQGYKGTYLDYQLAQRRAGATNVSLSNVGPKAFETELGKMDAEQLGEWRKGAMNAQGTLGIAKRMEEAEAKGAYSGGAANLKMTVGSYINGLTGATPKGQVGSELYNAEAKKLVLETVKALGPNPSNADREFIEQTIPQLTTNPDARRQLTQFMREKAEKSISLYERANAHARKNSGLGGFNVIEPTTDIEALVNKYK